MGATAYWAATGARGNGVKIGVVDDGVDQTNPFFAPAGLQYPAGFPKGARRWTSPKVIVARTFPGPGSGRRGRLAVDPRASFHGTHVAGIAAGTAEHGLHRRARPPTRHRLSGVAPNAYDRQLPRLQRADAIGNTAPDAGDHRRVRGRRPRRDERDQLLRRRPDDRPRQRRAREAVSNVAAAGVVPVISAGNDREEFGLGSAGAPGVAPDSIAVAALSNTHVFGPALTVGGRLFNFVPAAGALPPAAFGTSDRSLVDIGTVVGRDGRPVDRLLCASGSDPNAATNTLPRGSLTGAIALVSRGRCAIVTKAARAQEAGAVAMVMVDNRSSEANAIPIQTADPSGTVSDLDGAELRAYLAGRGGRAPARIGRETLQHDERAQRCRDELLVGRPDRLRPHAEAGRRRAGRRNPVLDHARVRRAVRRLRRDEHGRPARGRGGRAPARSGTRPGRPATVKSALVSTAGTGWADTARTQHASVLLSGSGLVNVEAADTPFVVTDPVSLSFGDLNVRGGARRNARLLSISDAGGGPGTWTVQVQPQSASAGAGLEFPASVTVAPGGTTQIGVAAAAASTAAAGDNYGFLLLRRGATVRKVAYAFFVTRPGLAAITPIRLRQFQVGNTPAASRTRTSTASRRSRSGRRRTTSASRWTRRAPRRSTCCASTTPWRTPASPSMAASGGALIHPWLLGTQDENDVQGYPGTPVNVNSLTFGYRADVGAAGLLFPRRGRYYVALDSGSDEYTGRSFAGNYVLRAWQNDVRPPRIRLITTPGRGRPLADRRTCDRRGRRRRPDLARDRVPAGARRRGRVRPRLRARALPDPDRRAAVPRRTDARGPARLRLPGVEERRPGRRERPAEHALPANPHARRPRACADLALARLRRTCAGRRAAAPRRRELDRDHSLGALLRRPARNRDRPQRRRRPLLGHVARRAGQEGAATSSRAVVLDRRGASFGPPRRARLPLSGELDAAGKRRGSRRVERLQAVRACR